jgi:hypothetical protein
VGHLTSYALSIYSHREPQDKEGFLESNLFHGAPLVFAAMCAAAADSSRLRLSQSGWCDRVLACDWPKRSGKIGTCSRRTCAVSHRSPSRAALGHVGLGVGTEQV